MRYLVRRPETLMDRFFSDWDSTPMNLGSHLDVYKEDDKYVVNLEMPGFAKEDITLDFKDDILSIEATHTEETEDDKKDYVYRSRRMNNVSRRIRFNEIDVENIDASYTDGVLTVKLPKLVQDEPQPKRIELK